MDLKKYNELRKKIHTKDFEGKNKDLDYWLYRISFIGNVGSIFFAFFLLFPALQKAILLNLISGNIGTILAIIVSIILLLIFEIIKRKLIKNLSFDLVKNKFNVIKASIMGWFIFSLTLIFLSFYLSLNGAKNFASTIKKENVFIENNMQHEIDSVKLIHQQQKLSILADVNKLKEINNELRDKLIETPLNYRTTRNEYQRIIDKNIEIINQNQKELNSIDDKQNAEISTIRDKYSKKIIEKEKESNSNIILFIIISTVIEFLIILGIFFREYYEITLYELNQDRLEKIYKKRDRYKALLTYIYKEGKMTSGDKIMGTIKLIELIKENTTISNPKKFIEIFLHDMENLNIFILQGKRRLLNVSYQEALKTIDNFDDALRILENLK